MLRSSNAFLAVCVVVFLCSACGDPIANSHINANVPASDQFSNLLARDLQSHFQAPRVDYELLRQGPTQTGISYPKYYLWVKIRNSSGGLAAEGAVRVAAIDQVRFEVTHFLPAQEIRETPTTVERVFPRPLVESILAHAKTAQ
jgi:hypothetical protein